MKKFEFDSENPLNLKKVSKQDIDPKCVVVRWSDVIDVMKNYYGPEIYTSTILEKFLEKAFDIGVA